ncbi:hypothetical protein [Roseateles koreensis]|uniref:Carboxypeptidase regulatory-like domain-containing protein n=1 Tax=Roseateles koreensis TaxID=2987526 RepID=A0ABT5KW16_9BURK|nr:hypothetical protein [Roseateles koreensis]MDC8787142.1 hypothetical protein [Roseateles koreensis]
MLRNLLVYVGPDVRGRLLRAFSALLFGMVVSACGGGSKGSDASTSSGGSTTFSVTPSLSGVAAVGSPLTLATITVLDGTGATVGSAQTLAADGSYTLSLSSKSLTAPLLVQARGMDAAGTMQVLHSAVPILSAAAPAMVAHITPLSQAIVALAVGGDPQAVFSAPTQNTTSVAAVATAASAASTFVKTLVKTQLSDLKISNTAALDLLADPAFAANKGAQDLLIETLSVRVVKNSKGVMELQLNNKLQPSQAAEVVVALPTAQTELLKTTASTPANAITSTLLATTSPTGTLANLGALDNLSAALNKLIAQGLNASGMAASPLLASYDTHNGRAPADVAAKLASYAAGNRQFGHWLITGCADVAVSNGLCNRVLVSAPISDASGTVVDLFSDAVSFNKTSTTGSTWNLIGNGRKLELAVTPMAMTALAADGSSSTSFTPNPSTGLQATIQAQSSAGTLLLSSATLQTAGNFSVPFAYCGLPKLCVSATAGATSAVPLGGVSDTGLLQSSLAWLGAADTARNAKFTVTYTWGGTATTSSVYLGADVPASPAASRFPTLDGVGSSAPLLGSQFVAGTTLNWANWAAANPDMRLVSVSTVLSLAADATQTPLITDTAVPLPPTTTLAVPALAMPSFTATRYVLWLGAQDALGQRFYTRYTLTTP